MNSTLRDVEIKLCKQCQNCLNMVLFAKLSYTCFCVYFLNMFMFNCLLNNEKAVTDEIKPKKKCTTLNFL